VATYVRVFVCQQRADDPPHTLKVKAPVESRDVPEPQDRIATNIRGRVRAEFDAESLCRAEVGLPARYADHQPRQALRIASCSASLAASAVTAGISA